MKDFAQQYLHQEQNHPHLDPYLYTTPEVRQQLLQMQGQSVGLVNIANVCSLILTAPLTTITSLLQLSVKPHKQIFQKPVNSSKELARINTALTIQEKRRMELMLRSGGERRPYTAPVYDGYRAVIRGLKNQGWKSFFKGLLFRSIHQMGHFYGYYAISVIGGNEGGIMQGMYLLKNLIKIWGLTLIADSSLNIFHILENRYILQSNIKQFRIFRNMHKAIKKMYYRKQIFTGVTYHFYNSFITVFVRIQLFMSLRGGFNQKNIGILYLAQAIMYPFNTAFRRLACQHRDIPGMIPLRYKGMWHAIRLIAQEEGVKGLYKGFGLHHLTMGIKFGCLGLLPQLIGQVRIQ